MLSGDLWDRLSDALIRDEEGKGIWEQIDQQAQSQASESANASPALWLQAVYQPGGIWQDIEDETLLLRPDELDLWLRLEIQRSSNSNPQADSGLWRQVESETLILRPGKADLWLEAEDETLILQSVRFNVWQLKPGDLTRYKPVRKSTWALKPLFNTQGQPYYILKSTESDAYLRLSPNEQFLWDLFDGKHTLQDIVIAYLIQYKSFDINGLLAFLGQVEANGFLANPRVDVYDRADTSVTHPSLWSRVRAGLARISEIELAVTDIDRSLTRVYRLIGGLLFHPVTQIFLGLLILLGGLAFVYHSLAQGYSPLKGLGSVWRVLGVYGLLLGGFFIHEMAHALMVKHYRREVRRGGVIIYLGMIAFFVDTTDIWLSSRRARIMVSWAGPYSGFVVAGAYSLLMFLFPGSVLAVVLFQSAFMTYLISLLQFNPLLKYDGYYILMDWLEIPCLRDRSIEFVRKGLWGKLRANQSFNREDGVFAVFGVLSLIGTGLTVGLMIVSWGEQIIKLFL